MVLELLALAASTPALASADNAMEPTDAARGPAALEVSTALDSCGTLADQVICKLDVSYNALPDAASYSAAVTRADGSVVDYGGVAPGGTSLWVPYVGSGNYSVRVTAYGAPEQPGGDNEVVSTEVTPTETETTVREAKSETEVEASAATSEAEAETRGAPEAETDAGQAEAAVEATPTAPTCTEAPPPEPIAPEPLPEPPPEDLDPANPDEDADGIPDEQERVEYDAAVAEQQAAEAVAEVPESVDC